MLKLKRILGTITVCLMILNIFTSMVYGVLPDFAIVESNSESIESSNTYKTAESSIQTATEPVFTFESQAQVLMESTTGEIIYANNENERLLPASVTKIMTLLLLMEEIDNGSIRYEDNVPCSEAASKMGGSQIWFKQGETLTVDEALKCICVVSANDVSYAVAELVGGSHENFVQMMNNKAKELGMENTNFMNAHGIDEEGHYTTAKDIAIMSRELITKHPGIIKYTTIWMDSIRGGTFELANTNKLLKTYEGMNGLKTGSTSQAGFNLSATATRDGLSLIAVVLKAPTSQIRNGEVVALLNYGFSAYASTKLGSKDEVLDNININKNIKDKVEVVYKQDEYLITKKGDKKEYTKAVEYNENITAPIKAGSSIGKVNFKDNDGNLLKQADVIITKDINKSSLWDYMTHIVKIFSIEGLKT